MQSIECEDEGCLELLENSQHLKKVIYIGHTTDNFIRLLTTFSNLEELELGRTYNNQFEIILTRLTKLKKLKID